MSKKYRLYIDESGTHNYSQSEKVDKRYLGLVGVIVSEEIYTNLIQPKIRELKQLFADDPDDLPVLHREDIVNGKGCFKKLNDPKFEKTFNEKLLKIIEECDYTICCVVLDKKSHLNKYSSAAYHPYHYCLNVLLERYTFLLEETGSIGDVMAEARGKKEDKELKGAYSKFYKYGTNFRSAPAIQQRLTSSSIKIKPKKNGVEGLELADLLALATKLDTLHSYRQLGDLTDNFCLKIVNKIQPRYRNGRNSGSILGYGKKLIK